MKIIVLIVLILLILLTFKFFSGKRSINTNKKKQNETIIDLEKDPKTKEYKPKE